MTEDEVQKLIRDEVDKKVKTILDDYFKMSRPGFAIESNFETSSHGTGEFCLSTDTGQGIHFYKHGNCKVLSNTSLELVTGEDANDKKPAISIRTENGDILIDASADLVLTGRNVTIQATDADGSISLMSPKIIDTKSPQLFIDSTKATIAATSDILLAGGTLELYCETGAVTTASGQDPILGPNVFSTIINITDKVRKILNRAG